MVAAALASPYPTMPPANEQLEGDPGRVFVGIAVGVLVAGLALFLIRRRVNRKRTEVIVVVEEYKDEAGYKDDLDPDLNLNLPGLD
jgi:hypothetical protein